MTLCDTSSDGLATLSEAAQRQTVRTGDISQYYTVERTPFARGKFAALRKCRHLLSNGEFAAKFIRRGALQPLTRSISANGGGATAGVGGATGGVGGATAGVGGATGGVAIDGVTALIHHEIAILQLAREAAARGVRGADRVVCLHEAFVSPTESALVLEMMAGGDLHQLMDADEYLDEFRTRFVLRHVLEALRFLHNHLIAHLDLKPQNILLSGVLPNCQVKLCDFGISRVVSGDVEVREILGTPDYVAPEVLQYEPISLSTDMWSLGVLTYVLLSGHSPFAGDTKQQTFLNVTQGVVEFPHAMLDSVSSGALDFISSLLVLKASKRLTPVQCLAHPWMCPPSRCAQQLPSSHVSSATSAIVTPPAPTTVTAQLNVSANDQLIVRKCHRSDRVGGACLQPSDQSTSNGVKEGRGHTSENRSAPSHWRNGSFEDDQSSSKVILLDKNAVAFYR